MRLLRRSRPLGTPVSLASAPSTLERLLECILAFWDERVIDPDGGYVLSHDVNGRPNGDDSRYLIPHARTVWFFARLSRSPYGDDRHLQWAAHGIAFMRTRLWDPEHGGFFWEIGPEGPRDGRKHLYAQAFGVFALAEFARVAGDAEAGQLALELARQMYDEAHDERYGGYLEARARDWSREPDGATSRLGLKSRFKTANTHHHLLEAFTTLAQLRREDWVLEQLRELILVTGSAAFVPAARTCAESMERDWTPAPGYRSSYGHDVEGVWLLIKAAAAAGVPDAPLGPVYAALWENALENGFDHESGGLYEGGPPNRRADRRCKVWWAQAELLQSALEMFLRTGDERYRDAFELTLGWIEREQADWEGGDWHQTIDARGNVSGGKSGEWKDPYHQGRAVIQCLETLSRDA